jgi:hypothetical protein
MMTLAGLLKETIELPDYDVWENGRSMGLSVREVPAALELLGVDRSHGAVWPCLIA